MSNILDTIQKTSVSRNRRQEKYGWYRIWFERGTDQVGPPARYNKIQAHLRRQSSFLYAPESTRFSVVTPSEHRKTFVQHVDVARDEMIHHWRNSGADVLWANMVVMGLVYGGVVAKVLPTPEYGGMYYIYPGDVGVLREDVPDWSKQEVITHWSLMTVSELAKLVEGHPQSKRILQEAMAQATPQTGGQQLPSMLQQVVATSISGSFPNQTVTGVTNLTLASDDHPETEEPMVEIAEVWEKCDYKTKSGEAFTDYLVTTTMGDHVLLERRNPVLPWVPGGLHRDPILAEHPFIGLIPDPTPDYIWGRAPISQLLQMQEWRETRMNQVDKGFELSLEPPRFFSGLSMQDEKLNALRKAGTYISSPMQGVRMDTIKPELPQNPLEYLHEIDRMFAEAGQLTETLQGSNPQGVRAGSQVSELAGIGIGPIRAQALIIEDALEQAATKMWLIKVRMDDTNYPLPNGDTFLLADLPPGTTVKVDAHSASPVYAEQVKQDAVVLYKAGAIDAVTLIELMNPPMMETLRDKARVLQDQKAEFTKKKLQIEEEKATRGRIRS